MSVLPKKTWKYSKQHRLKLKEREYDVTPRRTDFPLFYNPLNVSRLIATDWVQLKRLCRMEPKRVMFAWVADNESKSYRRPLDLLFRLTIKKTWIIGVFKPTRWYIKRLFNVSVYPTILWLGWEEKWIELGRYEGSNFTVSDLLEIEEDVQWRGKKSVFSLSKRANLNTCKDRWEKRLQWLSRMNIKGKKFELKGLR